MPSNSKQALPSTVTGIEEFLVEAGINLESESELDPEPTNSQGVLVSTHSNYPFEESHSSEEKHHRLYSDSSDDEGSRSEIESKFQALFGTNDDSSDSSDNDNECFDIDTTEGHFANVENVSVESKETPSVEPSMRQPPMLWDDVRKLYDLGLNRHPKSDSDRAQANEFIGRFGYHLKSCKESSSEISSKIDRLCKGNRVVIDNLGSVTSDSDNATSTSVPTLLTDIPTIIGQELHYWNPLNYCSIKTFIVLLALSFGIVLYECFGYTLCQILCGSLVFIFAMIIIYLCVIKLIERCRINAYPQIIN